MIVLNVATLGVVEWSVAPEGATYYDDKIYFLGSESLGVVDIDVSPASGYIQTGSLGLDSWLGKRCTTIAVDTLSEEMPVVTTIDQDDEEYPTINRRGAGTKRRREFDAPRGVLYSRIGVKVSGSGLDIRGVTLRSSESARR